MLSQKEAMKLERDYRSVLYRRRFGIGSILMLLEVCVFAVGISLSAAKITFPFYSLFIGVFSLLLLATALHWLLQSLVYLRKKDWTGLVMLVLGGGVTYLGARLLLMAVSGIPT